MDKLFWSVRKNIIKKDTTWIGKAAFKMDTGQVQDNIPQGSNQQTVRHKKARPKIILSLGERVLLQLLKNNTSRMMGDYHVRFCERLAGETPACLLGLVRFLILLSLYRSKY